MKLFRWHDISEWQPGERRDVPNRLSIEGPALRIVIGFRGEAWWISCSAVEWVHNYLGAGLTVAQAKQEAVAKVQDCLERQMADLRQMKVSP